MDENVTKADIVRFLNGLEESLIADWDGDAGNPDVFFCNGVDVDDETHEVKGFYVMEQEDGPQCSAGFGEFQVEVLGVTFTHDGDLDCWEDNEWETFAGLEDGELSDEADVDAALQEALNDKVSCELPEAEDRCGELSDDTLYEGLEDGGLDKFFVDAIDEPQKVYAIESDLFEDDELADFMPGKREITIDEAVALLQKTGYEVEYSC